jgi:N-methylhydantoinase B
VEFGPTEGEMMAIFIADGNVNNAKGARGGGAAAPSDQKIMKADGSVERLPQYCEVRVLPGQTLVSVASGGGGFGDPRLRPPESVADDVREGLVSRQRARDVYGVVIAADGTVERAETARLRDAQA